MKTISAAHTAEPHLARNGFWPDIGFTVLSILLILIAAIEGGGMAQRGFSESKMLESDMGHKLLRSDVSQSDSPISARVVHEGGPLIIGRPASNVSVAIRNNTAADPRQGVAIVLRGVYWAGEGEDTRQWLKQLKGKTEGSFDDYISHNRSAGGVTDLAFETGLVLPGEEIMVAAPLKPRQGGKHELVVRYAVVGSEGKDWSDEVFVAAELPRYDGAWFRPATPERVRKRGGTFYGAIVRSTSKPGAPPLPIQQTTIPLQLRVAPAPKSTGG